MEKFTRPDGTNDFLPEQMVERNYVETVVRETFEGYGYAEVQTPLFESFALLSAQSGEEVRQKMFTFVGSDRIDYALRPELTASVCRLIGNGHLHHLPYPHKLYYVGQCVRQEPIGNLETGREFRQAGVELVGPASPLADAEIITLPVRILEKLGIHKTTLKIGNPVIFRQIFQDVQLHPSDIGEIIMDLDALARQRAETQHSPLNVDKIRDYLNRLRRLQGSEYRGECRIEPDMIQELTEHNAPTWTENLPRIAESTYKAKWHRYLQVPEEIAARCIAVSKIQGDAEKVLAVWDKSLNGIAEKEKQELSALCDALHARDISDFEIALGLTRGFDFYTGTVFQIELTKQALCGGGRYDNLIEIFGGPSLPGAGFAFHFDALMAAFAQTGRTPIQPKKDYFIATASPELAAEAQRLAETLRRIGKTVEVELMKRDTQAQHEYAEQMHYEYVLTLTDEQPMQRLRLRTGEVETITLAELQAQAETR